MAMSKADTMIAKLRDGLSEAEITLRNQSHLHEGHAGHDGSGESHFKLTVISPDFEGVSRVQRQRMVNALLAEELAGPVHALTMTTLTPAEAAAKQ
ncbi:MAG: BolA family transcriptional regulator [Alphaproteobacteria bacterium]